MKTKGRYRRIVVRAGRRYTVCGLRARPAPPRETAPFAVWLPGVTFILVLVFSAYIIGRPTGYPLGSEGAIAHTNLARFTINDFANASR